MLAVNTFVFTSAIIIVFRFCLVGDGCETPSGDVKRNIIHGKRSDLRDLVKVPYDWSVQIDIAVFVSNKNICLRRSIVLVQPKADIALYIGIGDRDPLTYFSELADQCNGGAKKYGGITTIEEMRANLRMSCLPECMLDGEIPSFDDFLEQRRKLMAQKIKTYFEGL